ncbi:hypothetical protein, conserved [Plasmodium gonderi]|uniref:Uncharacterized protein n=1 Tax=Plasmodium gonderi TaxID=77519 RepID=A0A1Y1JQC5_PLAGO|nr:hypothetical protein, conserved [Plasmodium gonderi]GAW82264.1 hypothetical protein, conserved [Plasmodium gonderi]
MNHRKVLLIRKFLISAFIMILYYTYNPACKNSVGSFSFLTNFIVHAKLRHKNVYHQQSDWDKCGNRWNKKKIYLLSVGIQKKGHGHYPLKYFPNADNILRTNSKYERCKRRKKISITRWDTWESLTSQGSSYNRDVLMARKINQKEIKRKKNYQYAMKHMYDKNGRRIKDINKEKKSLKKKKIFDYEGFKVDKIFSCLSEEDMQELRDEELKRKSGEILHNNKYIDTYGVESETDLDEI